MDIGLRGIFLCSGIFANVFKTFYTLNKRGNQTQFGDNRAACGGTACKSFYRDCVLLNALTRAPQSFAKILLAQL